MNIADLSDDILIDAYNKTGNVHKAGELLGVRGQSLHRRLYKSGFIMNGSGNKFTLSDISRLKKEYDSFAKENRLDELAIKMGKTKAFLCRMARKHGLTNINRCAPEKTKKKLRVAAKERIKKYGHPKGMLGKKHSEKTKLDIGIKSKQQAKDRSPEDWAIMIMKQLKTREKNGTLVPPRNKVSWKQGWREIGGYRKYYRSRWEANYARYLQFLKETGNIKEWLHEPDVFWFEKIMRGCRSYLPDFKVTENNGSIVYHEVKGWMDDRSKTKLKRMAKYYPEIDLIVIESKAYKSIEKKIGKSLPGWE